MQLVIRNAINTIYGFVTFPQRILEILQHFIDENREVLDSIQVNNPDPNNQTINLCCDPCTHLVDYNPPLRAILINPQRVEECNLTEEELHAMLFHEIGHINQDGANRNNTNPDYWFNRETNADDMAVQNGFKDHLISGLEKYLKVYTPPLDESQPIQRRILRLREM